MNGIFLAGLLALLPSLASAHAGGIHTDGFSHGFLHPFGGMDHVLAMTAVGAFAAHLGGRALWFVPAAFVAMMVAGGLLAVNGIALPLVELGIALSVVVLGLAVAVGLTLPLAAAMSLVGILAVFHGQAHGAEMPETASGLTYGIGFVLATLLLHGAGAGLGLRAGQVQRSHRQTITQVAGGTMAVAGVAMLGGML